MRRRLLMLPASLCLIMCGSGCGLTVGPKVKDRIVFIKHRGVVARVAESKTVEVTVTDKAGTTYTQRMDVGGMYVVSPDELEPRPPEAEAKTSDEF